MSNFELIDDYLTGRLSEQENVAFEKQLESDPSLKADVDLQRQILEGVKKARAMELKSMLNKVPVNTGYTIEFSVAKIAAGVIGAGMIGAALYFALKPDQVPDLSNAAADLSKKSEQIQKKKEESTTQPAVVEPEQKKEETEIKPETKGTPSKKEQVKETPSEVKQPKIEAIDPSEEMTGNENSPVVSETHKGAVTVSHIDVETDTANKKYDFHYQFASGKLFLYGPFDKNMYEILEINGDNHALFFFYKDNYYLLDEKQMKVTHLEPIKDQNLVRKLKEYRSK